MRRLLPIMAMMLLVACHSDKMKQKAAGTPFDVVVAADNREAAGIVKAILETPVEMLPQSEPWFNVMMAKDGTLTNATKFARNVVVVKVGTNEQKTTRVRYERDVYANGQTVVYISTPSAKILRDDSSRVARGLIELLDQSELESEAKRIASRPNRDGKRWIAKTIGCSIAVPEDINSTKTGRNFVWLSNNASRAMQNICVYAYPGISLNEQRAIDMRDSVMRANIEGEEQGMYMLTERTVVPLVETKNGRLIMRGLWKMEGDAMGGPFVGICMIDPARNRIVVAEGFVYAPEQKKKLLIKRLEAAISTLQLHSK